MMGFGSDKSNNSRSGIMGLFEDGLENENSLMSSVISSAKDVIGEVTSDLATTGKDFIGGAYEAGVDLSQTVVLAEGEKQSNGKFSMDASINNFNEKKQVEKLQKEQKQKEAAANKKDFYQSLKEEIERAQRAKDKLLFEEEINDIATNLPTEQKNQLLHYQASYKDRSVYQRAELRKKLIEESQKQEKQKQDESLAQATAKGKTAMQGAFEGASGTQGGGQANLSFQAAG